MRYTNPRLLYFTLYAPLLRSLFRLFVCLSVCLQHVCIVHKQKTFCRIHLRPPSKQGSSSIVIENAKSIRNRLPRGCYIEGRMKNSRFSTNISIYLGNDTTYVHSFNVRRIGTRMRYRMGAISNDLE